MNATADNYDSPWKDAVSRYFQEFMAFYFPHAYEEIDWQLPHAFLEQELAQVAKDAELGARRVDKLVRVAKRGGGAEWVFVHIDVQAQRDTDFAERVFVYNYRIYDRFRQPVASLAVLADSNTAWKPARFDYTLFGCEVGIRFPAVKLTDFAGQVDELLRDSNVFALVTVAHLLTQQTKHDDVKRYAWKWCLARRLYERDWDRQRIVDLFNVIDWMMQIPAPLQTQLMDDIATLERNRRMPYISSFERRGLEQGLAQGRHEGKSELLAALLVTRFGTLPQPVQERIARASSSELETWGKAILSASTLDGVFSKH